MKARMNLYELEPDAFKALYGLENFVKQSGLDRKLLELIKIRASQINGCAYCLDMHTKDARLNGETEQRIYALNAWRETPFFSAAERAVLALTEVITTISTTNVPDDIYDEAAGHFTANELAKIIMAIVTINSWNRVAIATRTVPGDYVAGTHG